MSMTNGRSAAACAQTIRAEFETIPSVERTISRRPGRPKHIDSPLRARHMAAKAEIGPRLKAAMEADGLDQAQLAIACGTDQGTVSRWHAVDHPAAPSLIQAGWAADAGCRHWAAAARSIAGGSVLDDDTRRALQQARDAIAAVLGER